MPQQSSTTAVGHWRFSFLGPAEMILFLAAIIGCDSGDGLNRQAVSGKVTLDGQPLAAGAILFEPASNESGTAVGTTIRNGTFAISRKEGPVPGRYRVRIYSSSAIQAPPASGQTERAPRPMVERLPPRYNTKSELSAMIVAGRANDHRFDLSSIGNDGGAD